MRNQGSGLQSNEAMFIEQTEIKNQGSGLDAIEAMLVELLEPPETEVEVLGQEKIILIEVPDLSGSENPEKTENYRVQNGKVGVEGRKKERPKQHRVVRQLFKQKGEAHTNTKGKEIPARSVKSPCKITCKKQCSSFFSNEQRQTIHKAYWNLGFVQQREFLLRYIKREVKSRETVLNSRRKFTRKYYLPFNENNNIEVCKVFFQSTLDVGAKLLRYTENNVSQTLGTTSPDKRGKKSSSNKTPPHCIRNVRNFIENLPAVESHYCRSSTTKQYVPQEYQSLNNIYRKYLKYSKDNTLTAASEFIFKKIFTTEYNIGIHAPKKDKCVTCTKFTDLTSPSEAEQLKNKEHLDEKDAINKQYLADQKRAQSDKSFITCSFDLQKVLNTPCGSSILFFMHAYIQCTI